MLRASPLLSLSKAPKSRQPSKKWGEKKKYPTSDTRFNVILFMAEKYRFLREIGSIPIFQEPISILMVKLVLKFASDFAFNCLLDLFQHMCAMVSALLQFSSPVLFSPPLSSFLLPNQYYSPRENFSFCCQCHFL